MTWQFGAAVVIAGFAASLTDWLFMGILFHESYNTYPEVWWPGLRQKAADTRAITISSVLGFVTAAAVIGLCAIAGAHSIVSALWIAVLAWLAGPLVMQVTNGFWIKTDPRITVAHCAGYLARFLIAGLAAGVVLR